MPVQDPGLNNPPVFFEPAFGKTMQRKGELGTNEGLDTK